MFQGISRSLGARLLAFVLAISALIFIIVGVTSYVTTRNILIAQARDQARALAERSALAINGEFAPLYAIPGTLAANEQRNVDGETRLEQLKQTLRAQLEQLPSVQGIYMSFEKQAIAGRDYAEVWYTRNGNTIAPFYSNIPGNPGYNPADKLYEYRTEDWYSQPVSAGHTVWIEPYVDSVTGIGMVSATTPVTVDGKLLGVTGIDVSLKEVQRLVNDTHPTPNSYAMLVANNGSFVANPRFPDSVLHQTIGDLATAQNSEDFARLGQMMVAGETGLIEVRDPATGEVAWAAYQPVESTSWSTAVIIPQRDLLAGLDQLRIRTLLISSLGLALLAFLLFLLARSITQPLRQLTVAAQAMASGNFASRVRSVRQDEIGTLGNSFNSMAQALQERIEEQQHANEQLRAAGATKVAKEYIETVVRNYSAFANEVAQGNLTARVEVADGQDELTVLGHNLNRMVRGLHSITRQVQQASTSIASAAAEILASTNQQAASAAEQSAAITQTTTTVEEVKAIAQQTAQQATQLVQQSHQVLDAAQQGTQAVDQTVDGMGVIRERVDSIAHTILALVEQTQAIGEITQTVTDLADQSNLLALNAAIEAARAGEQGKGFAVVAQHVRELAERSKGATAQVREILNEIQRATSTAVMVTEEGTKGVTQGAELAGRAGQVTTRMAHEVESGAQANVQVAAAAQQQTAGMEQIGQAMGAIQQATTETLSSTRQAERAAKDLASLAQSLQQAVAAYHV